MAEEGWTTVSHAKKPSAPKPRDRPPRSDDPHSQQVLNLFLKLTFKVICVFSYLY